MLTVLDYVARRLVDGATLGVPEALVPLVVAADAKLSRLDPGYSLRRVAVADGELLLDAVTTDERVRPRFEAAVAESVALARLLCHVCGSARAAGIHDEDCAGSNR